MRFSSITLTFLLGIGTLLFAISNTHHAYAAIHSRSRHSTITTKIRHQPRLARPVERSFHVSRVAIQLLDKARLYLGFPYVWGGASPATGFDCSGFVQYVFKQFAITLPRTTTEQGDVGTLVSSRATLQPGDIVFFNTSGGVSHDGIYLGNENFINAASKIVEIDSLDNSYWNARYLFAKRVIAG